MQQCEAGLRAASVLKSRSKACEGGTLHNRLMWRAGIRKVRESVYEYIPGCMRAQVVVDDVRDRGEVMWLGTAEGAM